MSTDIQVTPSPSSSNDHISSYPHTNSASLCGNAPPVEGHIHNSRAGDIPTINDVWSLKKGVMKTSKDKVKPSYNIILVGETGVGKSSVLELIANVLAGNDIDHYNFDILEHTTEQGGSKNQTQTNSIRFYELASRNGIVVRIIDTPGLADTRSLQHDESHMRSIVTQIKKHIDSITAVLVVANGTVPRLSLSTDYGLSALSAISPKTLAHNVAFLLTNTSNPLYQNFSVDTLPDVLKAAPQFLLNNPIALQRKYLGLMDDPDTKSRRIDFREAVQAAEQNAGETLVDLFDWLDGLESQPMTRIVSLYEKCQNVVAKITHRLTRQIKELIRKVRKV